MAMDGRWLAIGGMSALALTTTLRRGSGNEDEDARQRALRCAAEDEDGVAGMRLSRAWPWLVRIGRRPSGTSYAGGREVTIYRGVPKRLANAGLRPGDWVALSRSYAALHGGAGSVVIQKRVPAQDVAWAGTDPNEWWWCPGAPGSLAVRPQRLRAELQAHPQIATRAPQVVWIGQTDNRKTGNVPTGFVGGSELEAWLSCTGCPRRDDRSCYAWSGRVAANALKTIWKADWREKKKGAGSLSTAIAGALRSATIARLGAIGDPGRIDADEAETIFESLRRARLGLVTYTHFWRDPAVARVWRGHAMASCDQIADADVALAQGWRVAVVVPPSFPRVGKTPGGKTVIVCPAQVKPDAVTCNTCRLCDASKPGPVIGFRYHGSATSKKADAIGFGGPAQPG